MNTLNLNGSLFAQMVKGGAANLGRNRTIVNDLNVFPIPDGDTGDNMYMTMDAGVSAIPTEAGLEEVSAKIAKGMLLGARGNSGVILSRVFAGIADGFSGKEQVGLKGFAEALEKGVAEAYEAVAVPVEGTMLTVYRDAVSYANDRVSEGMTFENYFDIFLTELRASLERTPELLEVLKEAGVVDSGGAGIVYIAEGMERALLGEVIVDDFSGGASKPVDLSAFGEDSVLEFGYCTEFLLQLQSAKVDLAAFDENEIINHLTSVGESVVAFREGSILKVHVHTMTPGDILNYCQQFGEFLTLKIENMTLQHNEKTAKQGYVPEKRKAHKAYGSVAVAAGAGLKDTFLALGTDFVVEGGQSMNPSAEDFIRAFDEVGADVIFVFPNNGNVILTAKQAASLYDKSEIRVIETRTIGEGYAALSMMDTSSGDTATIEEELIAATEGVVTGMVSMASRDTDMDGVHVVAGDYIGFAHGEVYSDAATCYDAALSLAEALGAKNYDIILLFCGADADADEAKRLYESLKAQYKRSDVIMIDGGQPVYNYMMILE